MKKKIGNKTEFEMKNQQQWQELQRHTNFCCADDNYHYNHTLNSLWIHLYFEIATTKSKSVGVVACLPIQTTVVSIAAVPEKSMSKLVLSKFSKKLNKKQSAVIKYCCFCYCFYRVRQIPFFLENA